MWLKQTDMAPDGGAGGKKRYSKHSDGRIGSLGIVGIFGQRGGDHIKVLSMTNKEPDSAIDRGCSYRTCWLMSVKITCYSSVFPQPCADGTWGLVLTTNYELLFLRLQERGRTEEHLHKAWHLVGCFWHRRGAQRQSPWHLLSAKNRTGREWQHGAPEDWFNKA